MSADPTPPPATALPLDALMELATPLLREAFDDVPPEQAAITALGRRIRAEVARIHAAGRTAAAADLARTFRSAAIYRREYMGVGEQRHDELLSTEVVTLESAARVADGDLGPLYTWLPSWRWTDEMNARLNARLDAKDPTDDRS